MNNQSVPVPFDHAEGWAASKVTVYRSACHCYNISIALQLDYQVKILNRLEVVKRRCDFTLGEVGSLYEHIEECNTRVDSCVGAYLMLGQQRAAELDFLLKNRIPLRFTQYITIGTKRKKIMGKLKMYTHLDFDDIQKEIKEVCNQ